MVWMQRAMLYYFQDTTSIIKFIFETIREHKIFHFFAAAMYYEKFMQKSGKSCSFD
jgi:hypothetical protein